MVAASVGPGVPPPAAGPGAGPGPAEGADVLFVALSAGFTSLSHPLLYVKLLVQVRLGHSPRLPVMRGLKLLRRPFRPLPLPGSQK